MISTADLSAMPDLAAFRRLVRSLAALDAVMSPEWAYRYYSFDPAWGEGDMMASMRNGSGDQWFVLISPAGAAIVGLAHESPSYTPNRPHPGLFVGFPEAFRAHVLDEPAFETSNATFCIWRLADDDQWRSAASAGAELPAHDGSAELLEILEGRPEQYVAFAEDYYERDIELEDVEAIYEHRPISSALLARLNPDADVAEVEAELTTLGFPEA